MNEASGARTGITAHDSNARSWEKQNRYRLQFETPKTVLLVQSSSFTRDETNDRSSHLPKLARALDDENSDVFAADEIESWVSQDLLKTCAFVEPTSGLYHCQIGMTAIVMGDVNAVFTLECARHR